MQLWRIQDCDGRGPFRPGFSARWRDATGEDLPPFFEELNWHPTEIQRRAPAGMHIGCACRSEADLMRWFSRPERRRLKTFGFRIVNFEPDQVIAETPTQIVFANHAPLRTLWFA